MMISTTASTLATIVSTEALHMINTSPSAIQSTDDSRKSAFILPKNSFIRDLLYISLPCITFLILFLCTVLDQVKNSLKLSPLNRCSSISKTLVILCNLNQLSSFIALRINHKISAL